MSLFGRWFGYGVGAAVGKALVPKDDGPGGAAERARDDVPIGARTEEAARADEKRFAEDEKRIESEVAAKEK